MKRRRPPTSLELALLGLIHQEARTGYDLCKVFETTPMGHYSSSPGAIYPALKRLEGRGLIEGEVDGHGSLRPRKVYRLVDEGLRKLRDWARRPVTRDDVVWGIDELMLRFGFMGQLVDRKTVCRFLEDLARNIDELVVDLESYREGMVASGAVADPSVLPTGRLALEQGISSYRCVAAWARSARRELAESSNERRTQ